MKMNKGFGYWFDDMQKETSEPDALTIVFMVHFLGCNITLISGKGERMVNRQQPGCGYSTHIQRRQHLHTDECRYISFIFF